MLIISRNKAKSAKNHATVYKYSVIIQQCCGEGLPNANQEVERMPVIKRMWGVETSDFHESEYFFTDYKLR